MTNTSVEYRAWKAMRWRCNPKNPHTKNYHDRGITVCERWDSFNNFLEDMGKKPEGDFSVDRIDNDKGYYPENCRWATRLEQTNNTKRTNYYIDGDKKVPLMEIARGTGIHPETIRARIKKGWSYNRVINTPLRATHRKRDVYGKFV